MNKKRLLQTLILGLTLFIVGIGCGGRQKSANSDHAHCSDNSDNKDCDKDKDKDHEDKNKDYVKGWSSDINFTNKKDYQNFLEDYLGCTNSEWQQWVGTRCKDWDNKWGSIFIDVESTSLPTHARVGFRVFHDHSNAYRDIYVFGDFTEWNDSQGFAMWASNNTFDLDDPHLRGRLQLHVEVGQLEDRRLKVDLYYRSKYLGYSYVYTDYEVEDEEDDQE